MLIFTNKLGKGKKRTWLKGVDRRSAVKLSVGKGKAGSRPLPETVERRRQETVQNPFLDIQTDQTTFSGRPQTWVAVAT
jgi:hypothetical protein